MSGWTEERVDQLKQLWTEGLSCSQIARQLGGVTRNAVIGKVTRLDLPGRATVVREPRSRAPRIARTVTAHPKVSVVGSDRFTQLLTKYGFTEVPGMRTIVPAEGEEPRHLTMGELLNEEADGARLCHYSLNDDHPLRAVYCGCEREKETTVRENQFCVMHQIRVINWSSGSRGARVTVTRENRIRREALILKAHSILAKAQSERDASIAAVVDETRAA